MLSLLSLLRLAAAVQEAAGKAALALAVTVVANGLSDVTGDERLSPGKAALLGLAGWFPWSTRR